MIDLGILERLNAPTPAARLENLGALAPLAAFPPADRRYVNNHIHTAYSFSPYSPTAAAYAAKAEGLATAGIIDHDSMAGAAEFLDACRLLALPATIGMEARISWADSPFAARRINNPDQAGVAYMTFQAVPHGNIEALQAFFAPYRAHRHARNQRMVENINRLLAPAGIALSYAEDVLPLSKASEGGGVTERHLLYALALAMVRKAGPGQGVVALLESLGVALSGKQRAQLLDVAYPFYAYDLLGILKGAFISRIYVDAGPECPSLAQAVALAKELDCYLCYAYLGDVTASVTGDKKAQAFEDGYLDALFAYLWDAGVRAVTYMPARNTRAQLMRVRGLCEQYGMFQVSGEDINSPRQAFACKAMEDPLFENLIENTWALIRHEAGQA